MMVRAWLGILAAAAAVALAAGAKAADFETFRHIRAGTPTQVTPPPQAKTRPVQFARIVVHPPDGEPWAIAYVTAGVVIESLADNRRLIIWKAGAAEGDTAAFGRAFDDELKKAGFPSQVDESLFDDSSGAADLKVGVTVDELKGRFCLDCPNMFHKNEPPGTVLMTAHWEIYSSLERKVVAKVTTRGGADYSTKLNGNFFPAVLEGFRENVRQLLASEDFRRVLSSSGAPAAATSASPSIALLGPRTGVSVAAAAKSVAIIYAADGQGSGFLVSSDGYVLTNQHVVGGSKYVKLKWPNGAETPGEVVRADRRRDVALIKTEAQGRAPLALRPGPVQQGETVFAIGTPLDDKLQNTMTKGIISAERTEQGLRLIQSDAAINHGNSGGPLIDDKGAVVAIAVSGILPDSHQMGLNFFIPIDDALKTLALTPVAVAALPSAKAKPTGARKH